MNSTNFAAVVPPSKLAEAMMPWVDKAAMVLMVLKWLWGTLFTTRTPGAARPWVRCILVLAPNSSRKTKSTMRMSTNRPNQAALG